VRLLARLLGILVGLAALASVTNAQTYYKWNGYCQQGGQSVVTGSISSTSKVQGSFPGCTVLVSIHGGGAASLFQTATGNALANPFTADAVTGQITFYAPTGHYDITIYGGNGVPTATWPDIIIGLGNERFATLPSSCLAGLSPSATVDVGGADAIYVCDNTGHYVLPPGGSTTVCAGAVTGPCSALVIAGGANGFVVSSSGGTVTTAVPSLPGGMLSYTAPYSGAVTRTGQSKWSDVVSVLDFGADRTGVADSSAAFNAALATAAARGGVAAFMPCGAYTLNSTVTLDVPGKALVGEVPGCVHLILGSQTSGIVQNMVPFTTDPAGEMGNFSVTCSASTTYGIDSGQMVGAWWHNIDVSGCNKSGAAAYHIHAIGSFTTWAERNHFGPEVSAGGLGTLRNTHGFLLDADNTGDSFGYNSWEDIKVNVSTGQEGFTLASGFMYNIPQFNLVCNEDNNLAGSLGPICIRSSSNWDSNVVHLNGEYQASGSGTGTAYRLQVDSGGRFSNMEGSYLNVFAPGGAQVADNILASACPVSGSCSPNVSLVQNYFTSWDTGNFTLSGITTVPHPRQRANYGSLGLLIGNNIESPYVSMFQGSGNKFQVLTVPTGGIIGTNGIDVANINLFGQLFSSSYTTQCNSLFTNCTAPGSIDGSALLNIGATTSAHRAGFTNSYYLTTTGINESMSGDPNFSGGCGFVEGSNISHSMCWGYNLDPFDFEVYEKPTFQVGLVPGNSVFQIQHGGNIKQSGNVVTLGNGKISAGCLNIMAYGADPTHTASNNSAWTAVLAAGNPDQQCVYFPHGNYLFATSPTWTAPHTNSSITIKGDGDDVSQAFFASGQNGFTLNLISTTNTFHVEGMSLRSHSTNAGSGLVIQGTQTSNTYGAQSSVEGVSLYGGDCPACSNSWTIGIDVINFSVINFSKVKVVGPAVTNSGVGMIFGANSATPGTTFNLQDIEMDLLDQGIQIQDNIQGVTINQSNFTGLNTGVNVLAGLAYGDNDQLTISNSQFNASSNGVLVQSPYRAVTIHDNRFVVPGAVDGILLQNYAMTDVHDNQFTNVGGGGGNGIVFGTYSHDVSTVANNTTQFFTTGIFLQSTSQNVTVLPGNTGASNTSNIVNSGTNNTVPVSCPAGAPSASYTVVNGIITHC
jgi:hypothetical protein